MGAPIDSERTTWEDLKSSSPQSSQPSLLKRFIDEGDLLLGRALETEEGRRVYNTTREGIETDSVYLSHEICCDRLLHYAERQGFTLGAVKILAWAMVKKAVADLIYEELSQK